MRGASNVTPVTRLLTLGTVVRSLKLRALSESFFLRRWRDPTKLALSWRHLVKSTARTLLLLVSSEIVHTMRAQIALSINFNNYKINSYTLVSSINEQERER